MGDVKVGEGETEVSNSPDAKEEEGSSVCWAITDGERMRTSLRVKAGAQDLRRAIVGGDRQLGDREEGRSRSWLKELAPTCKATNASEYVRKKSY